MLAASFLKKRSDILLLKSDGEIQLTLYVGANSADNDLHKPRIADFETDTDE